MPIQTDNLSTVASSTLTSSPSITDTILDSSSAEITSGWNMQHLQGLLEAGGPVIMILAVMSLVSLIVFLAKCGQFLWLGMGRYKAIHAALQFWHDKQIKPAHDALNKTRNPIANVLVTAMYLKQNSASDDIAREEVTRIAKRELASARSYLKILEVIATLSPLLGLLGTVLGMITAFQKLQGAGSTIDPALLSGGIWEALLTTAAGLIVAIPALVGLHWLEQRIECFKQVMEDTMTQVFTSDLLLPEAINVTRQLISSNTEVSGNKPPSSSNQDSALALAT